MSPKSRVAANLIANYGGSIAVTLLSFAFIPLYIRYLGIGGYGLVGFFVTLQAVLSLLNLGLGMTLIRELAAISAEPAREAEGRDLVRTLEAIYWTFAAIIGLLVYVAAPLIAEHWVRSSAISPEVVTQSIRLMGLAIALNWPSALYGGGLEGLQRQVLLNWIQVTITFVRGAGAVFILARISATVPAFFAWQAACSALLTIASGIALWRLVGRPSEGRFRVSLLRGIYRFAAGMIAIGVTSTLLTQVDKVILSKVLTLEQFGYYTLAFTIGSSLYRLSSPVVTAIFPRLTQVATGDPAGLAMFYHRAAQVISVAVFPAAAVMILFAPELIMIWTGDPANVANASTAARLLVAGTALSGCYGLPYVTQLAHGWTSLSLYVNLVAIAILVPGVYFAAARFGGEGAAAMWLILNACYVVFAVQPMYRRYLRNERARWYAVDLGVPLIVSLMVASAGKALWVPGLSRIEQAGLLALISGSTLLAATAATPLVRRSAMGIYRTWSTRLRQTAGLL